jgi:hypothetical protein
MQVYNKYRVAEKVKRELLALLREYDKANTSCRRPYPMLAMVQTYQNGRENGFTVSLEYDRNVTFAEYRSSDDIAVYADNFACQGLTDEAYQRAKFFRYDEVKKAATYCFRHLLDTKGNGRRA